MKQKYRDGINLLEENKYNEAYDYFNKLYQLNKKDYAALFYATVIKFLYLEADLNESINIFNYLLKSYPKGTEPLNVYLSMAYDLIGYHKKAVFHAKNALNYDNCPKINLYLCIAKNLFYLGGEANNLEALEYINKCIALDDTEIMEFLYLKFEILISLRRAEEFQKLLNESMIKYSGEASNYYYQAKWIYETATTKEDYTKALEAYQVYLRFYPDDVSFTYNMYTIHKELGNFDEATKYLDKLGEISEKKEYDLIFSERLYLIAQEKGNDEAVKIGNEYLKAHPKSKEVYTTIGELIYYRFEETNEDKRQCAKEALPYLEKAYQLSPDDSTLTNLNKIYIYLDHCDSFIDLLKKHIEINPNSGLAWDLLSVNYQRMNYDYDMVEKAVKQANRFNQYNYLQYIDMIIPIAENPKIYNSNVKYALKNIKIEPITNWSKCTMGLRCIYGDNLKRPIPNKAFEYFSASFKAEPTSIWATINMGIYYEMTNQPDRAFEYYQNAYNHHQNEPIRDENSFFVKSLHTPLSFMAHAYLQGIGVEKNLEKAKNLILEAVEKYNLGLHSTIIYLYVYLYLIGEIDVDGNDVLKMLNYRGSFKRYDISKEVLKMQVQKKLNLDYSYSMKFIKKAYQYDSYMARKHYNEKKNDPVFYPFMCTF